MPKPQQPPLLSVRQVLRWADVHYKRTGSWPHATTGAIREMPGEMWAGVNTALRRGDRGLPDGSALSRLLGEYPLGGRRGRGKPPLTIRQILAWAKACHQRTGHFPHAGSGITPEALGETWHTINIALARGYRGLPGGNSLGKLLRRHQAEQKKASE